MPELIIWKDKQLGKLRKDVDQMFDRLCGDFGLADLPSKFRRTPKIELTETADSLIVRAEIPGLHPEDIDIAITENSLTMKGTYSQSRAGKQEGFRGTERRYGSFSRTVHLSCRIRVEDVKARYSEGVIMIAMPKCKGERPRTLKIET